MERKEFIKTCGIACIGGTTLVTLLQSCASSNYYANATFGTNQIIISKSEFHQTKKDKTVYRVYVLVKSEKYNYPICIYRFDEENYSALLTQCTHKGCELQPQGNYLACPCHGSEFTNKGIVQNPPAERNLQTFKITTDYKNIFIHI